MDTENIKTKYEPRILALFAKIGAAVTADGVYTASEPYEMTDEEHQWHMSLNPATDPDNQDASIDISFTITESAVRDGSDEGIAFMLDIVAYGGEMLGGFSPYNYTEELWIPLDNADAVETRFAMFEEINIDSILEAVNEYEYDGDD
jgi:hypothetical protein